MEQTHQHIADTAFGHAPVVAGDPISAHGHLCMAMTAGGRTLGVLGVPESAGPFNEGRRRVLAAAATLLAITLRNAQLFREVRENSLRDGLTGCFNRTHALEVIDTELRRARRSQAPVSLIMFDIDHFKDVNDRYGHLCGDAVLAAVGSKMRDVLRGSDSEVPLRRGRVPGAAAGNAARRRQARGRHPPARAGRTCRWTGRTRRSRSPRVSG